MKTSKRHTRVELYTLLSFYTLIWFKSEHCVWMVNLILFTYRGRWYFHIYHIFLFRVRTCKNVRQQFYSNAVTIILLTTACKQERNIKRHWSHCFILFVFITYWSKLVQWLSRLSQNIYAYAPMPNNLLVNLEYLW